tara:strand:- start:2252 stop:3022 length:771 start_codon:yes stop_codon:yes gene_type:complete
MSAFGKLWTALKGGANEAAEKAADSQAFRILDQELREADANLKQARSDLAGLMASSKKIEKRLDGLYTKEETDIGNARSAMEAGREDLARQLAQRISATRDEIARDEKDLEQMRANERQMLQTVRETESRIQAMKREVESVKATDSLQKAQSAIASSHSGVNSKLGSAMGSLERIRDRQNTTAARIEAGAELEALESGADLDRQLLEAGIGGRRSSEDDILAEIAGPSKSAPQLEGPSEAIDLTPSRDRTKALPGS